MTKVADTVEQSIIKEFGKNILIGGQTIIDSESVTIPVSPKLDLILGGGIPEGSFVTFTGQPKSGKTSLALDFAATCQNPEYGGKFCPNGREVYFYNIEGRLKKRDLKGIHHLNIDKVHVITSQPGKILNAAEYLQIAEKLINQKLGSVHIIDSYSALSTEAELTADMSKMQRADGAKLLAKFCRKVANVIPINKNVVIGITHLMGNPTGYGAEFKEKSGQAIAYQVDVKLRAKAFRAWKLSENGNQIGQEIDWQCVTSALGPPGQKTTSYFRYNYGIDTIRESINLGVDFSIIKKGGAWYELSFLKESEKYQGLENVRQALIDNPDWNDKLNEQIKQMIG